MPPAKRPCSPARCALAYAELLKAQGIVVEDKGPQAGQAVGSGPG